MLVEKKTIRTTRTVTETEKRTIRRTSKIFLTDNQGNLTLALPSPSSETQTSFKTEVHTSPTTEVQTSPKVLEVQTLPRRRTRATTKTETQTSTKTEVQTSPNNEAKTSRPMVLEVQTLPRRRSRPSPKPEVYTDTEENSVTTRKVFSNTPAQGELQRGDVIVSIGERSGEDLTHKQAKDLIEGGGGQINLVLTRPPPGRHDGRGQQQAPAFRTPAPVAPRSNPPKAMPYGGGGPAAGHKPKKLNLSRYGGGGPDFGSDFSRPYTTAAPQQVSRPSYRPVAQQNPQMLNRVQESLDSIIYSPRTPEGYQAPFQPAAPPPFQPNMSMSGYLPQQSAPQQGGYRPTCEQVDSGQYDEDEEFIPVWEMRKTFQDQRPPRPVSSRSTPVPKVPKPVYKHPDAPSFGVDYSQGQPTPVKWAPQRGPPQPPSKPIQSEPPVYPVESETMAPWRETLKSTGVKPWDVDLDYAVAEPAPRSGPYNPVGGPQPVSQYNPPAPAPVNYEQQGQGDSADGPRVVHLQYNSPMGLYSQQNVKETLDGQTKAQLGQGPQSQQGAPMKDGERDWNASAVYRMIHQDDRRPGPGPAQRGKQPRPAPAPKPVVAPSYQPAQQFSSPGYEDDVGISDF